MMSQSAMVTICPGRAILATVSQYSILGTASWKQLSEAGNVFCLLALLQTMRVCQSDPDIKDRESRTTSKILELRIAKPLALRIWVFHSSLDVFDS
jgi:hypothetical protein